MHSFKIYSLIIPFVLIILFPIINSKFNFIADIQNFENRKAASQPVFNVDHLDPYPAEYENFYNENFNLRSRMIRFYNLFKLVAFKQSPMPDKIIVGSDGWLFQAGDDINTFLGKNKLSTQELMSIKKELELRVDYLEKLNCKFYLLVAPSKASVYSEKLGHAFQKSIHQSLGEQLISFLENNSKIKCIDAFKILRTNKTKGELYHKLDNHWNDLGAFVTANEIFKQLKNNFPSMDSLSLPSMNILKTVSDSGNMQKMLGYLPMYKEIDISIKPHNGFLSATADKKGYQCPEGFAYPWEFEEVRTIDNSNKPKLLIISDSFGKAIFPFLAENFARSIKIFDAWKFQLNKDIVEVEKPDVMILEVNEPLIRNILENKKSEKF